MPLQSGSNKMLALMQRRYKRGLYSERVNLIKELMPHACIGVDVIVGFPGETDEEFMETYNFLNELDVSYLHVFTYSERPNTKAVDMDGVVDMHVRRKRNKMLRILSEKKKRAFYSNFVNTERTVLLEKSKTEGYLSGYTDNYIRIELPFDENLLNTVQKLKLLRINEAGLMEASAATLVNV